MQDIVNRVHAHMPYHLLPKHLDMILQRKLNLEIYFHHWVLEKLDKTKCIEHAKILADAGLRTTFHAPFMDLRPGALDERVRRVSIDRIKQAFDLAFYFHPLKIVCHSSFDERYYVFVDDLWLENSMKTWTELIALARDVHTMIALENVYEKNPGILRRLFDVLSSEHICFCFDTGHFNAFAHEPLSVWLKALGKYLGHLHLHDNLGKRDEHLPVGEGTFPFAELFETLRKMKIKPTVTLEAHNPNNLRQSMENIRSLGLVKYLK
ncbi:MAG TPA: sugar phosphate isomerase/epimerase family protein [Smithella sp.]|nr:sugar phosphate isomerase/epimerase family protein [Smithella sp.]HOG89804.1 sugar phosphate isomerase/epimerase family protein [Smithella sp.]